MQSEFSKVGLKDTNDADINPATQDTLASVLVALGGNSVGTNPKFWEDTAFVTGDSPVVIDINTALGKNAVNIEVKNVGAGQLNFQLSIDGVNYGDVITLGLEEAYIDETGNVDSVRLIWVANTAYKVLAK
jgi:hypothetical protein